MSDENATRVRESLDAFDRRDRSAFLARRDPACEVVPDGSWPEAGEIVGREAVWEFYLGVAETFGMDNSDAEVIDAGSDKVVVHRAARARGRASGASVVFTFSVVMTFRDGKIVHDRWFADRAKALEDAGLSE